MADRVFYQQNPVQYRRTSSMNTTESSRNGIFRRLLFIVLFVGSALFVAEILFQTVVAPRVAITDIIIEGDVALDTDQLLDYAGISTQDLYFSVDTVGIERAIAAIPRVQEVEVEKSFPGTLRIILTERTPLAITMGEVNGRSVPVIVDEQGVVFGWGLPRDYGSLPVLGGFEIANAELGNRLPGPLRSVLADLSSLRMKHPVLFEIISEVEFEPVHEHRFDLVLYFTHVTVPVRIGEELAPVKISGIVRILDVLSEQDILNEMLEIDFRGDDVIYTKREG
ncbi:MAG: cell division protein FtsQ/DivIB [Spirochaeta sp.]